MALARFDGIAPLAGSLIAVRLAGTITLATLAADTLGTPLANPFSADVLSGIYDFYADDGANYDVTSSGTGSPSTLAPGAPVARVVTFVYDDNGVQIVLAQTVYDGSALGDSQTRTPSLPLIVAHGTSPNRTVSFVVDDNGQQVILAQVVY